MGQTIGQGRLIVFEGGEGAGKTTQLTALAPWIQHGEALGPLRQLGYIPAVLTTRQPGGTALGEQLRSLLLTRGNSADPGQTDPESAIVPLAELLLYAADRAHHVQTLILPALAAGAWVLCDRFTDSTVAYQGYGRGLDLATITHLNQVATGGLTPDLTIWLRLPPATGLARSQKRGPLDRIEVATQDFHERVYQGFQDLATADPHNHLIIDATATAATVTQQIQTHLLTRCRQWYPQVNLPQA